MKVIRFLVENGSKDIEEESIEELYRNAAFDSGVDGFVKAMSVGKFGDDAVVAILVDDYLSDEIVDLIKSTLVSSVHNISNKVAEGVCGFFLIVRVCKYDLTDINKVIYLLMAYNKSLQLAVVSDSTIKDREIAIEGRLAVELTEEYFSSDTPTAAEFENGCKEILEKISNSLLKLFNTSAIINTLQLIVNSFHLLD